MLLSGGHLVGSSVTAADVDRARAIWGPNSDSLMTNPFKSDSTPHVAKIGRTIPRGPLVRVAFADILFLWGVAICMLTVRPLGITFSHFILNRSETELTGALMSLSDKIKSGEFKIDEIHFDPEKSAAGKSCKAQMGDRGISMVPGTRDALVVVNERENGLTRRRLVQLFLGLLFRVPLSWIPHATAYVLDMKNFALRSDQTSTDHIAAEMFYGRQFHHKEFWIKFGYFVLSKIPESARTDKGYYREECIFVRRDWFGDDTVVLYSLTKKKFVNMKYSELTLLPLPSHAVEVLNDIADAEMKR